MDENEILKVFAKALGAEDTLSEIEAKAQKQKKMLEGMAKLLGTEDVLQEIDEQQANQRRLIEEKREREKKLLDELNDSLSRLVDNNPEYSQTIEQEISETISETMLSSDPIIEDLGDLPQIPVRDIVTQAVVDLSKVQQKDVQQVADGIPDSFRKELDIIKKSIADFHRLAQRQSQMGGGGEVNLRYLDDIARGSIGDNKFLRYNESVKKFEFYDFVTQGAYLGNFEIVNNHINLLRPGNTNIVLQPTGTGYVELPKILLPVSTIEETLESAAVTVSDLILDLVVDYSTGAGDALLIGDYGLPSGINHPWTVYRFTTTPSPVLQIEDIISGAGLPLESKVLFVGSGANSNIVVADKTIVNSVPSPNTIISIVRPVTQAGFVINTDANTNISLATGNNGLIINHSHIIPYESGIYDLGTSTKRFRRLWLSGATIYLADETLGYDLGLTARDGLFVVEGTAGLKVGEFTLQDNQIRIANTAREILIGETLATGNVVFNRPIVVKSYDTGNTTFAVSREGRVAIRTPSIPAGDIGALSIIGSANGAYQGVVNPGGMLHITGNDGVVSRITNDGFGTGAFPAYISRAGRGTANTPSAVQSGDIMSRYSTVGWGNTSFTIGPAPTNIEVYARENFTDIAQGTEYRFFTAPIGSTTKTLSAVINSDQTTISKKLLIGGDTTINGNLTVTGTTLYANVDNVNVANLVITLAFNSPTASAADGAGLVVSNTGVTWLYDYAANSWQSNVSIVPYANTTYDLGSTSLYWETTYTQNIYSNSVSIVNPTFLANQSVLTVRGAAGTPQTLTNPGALVHLVNQANRPARLIIDTYANNSYGLIAARTARGSIDSPSNLLANDVIFRIAGNGFGNTVFNSTSPVSIDYVATENFSDTNRGSKMVFYTTQAGANLSSSVTSIEYDGIHLAHIVNTAIGANVTNLHVTGGANDYIMVADGLDNLIWRPRHTDGTWTPKFQSGLTNVITMSVRAASWTKNGPIVTCFFDANVSSLGTASGPILLNGLPFIAKADAEYVGAVEIQAFYNMNIADCIRISGAVNQNSNTADMFMTRLNGQQVDFTTLTAANLRVNTRLIGSVIYDADF